jgi:hypothetical protein
MRVALYWLVLVVLTNTAGASATVKSRPTVIAKTKQHKVVHSPYARAAGAHSTAPTPGNPIKGHSAVMVQGLGTSGLRKHTVGRPH